MLFNLFGKNKEDGKMTKTLTIEGMKCPKCSARAEKALNALEGVTATVDLDAKKATCKCDENVTDEMLTKAVTDAGYTVTAVK